MLFVSYAKFISLVFIDNTIMVTINLIMTFWCSLARFNFCLPEFVLRYIIPDLSSFMEPLSVRRDKPRCCWIADALNACRAAMADMTLVALVAALCLLGAEVSSQRSCGAGAHAAPTRFLRRWTDPRAPHVSICYFSTGRISYILYINELFLIL